MPIAAPHTLKQCAVRFQTQIARSLVEQYNTTIVAHAYNPKDNIIFVKRLFASARAVVSVAVSNGPIAPAGEETYHNLARPIGLTPSPYIFIATAQV